MEQTLTTNTRPLARVLPLTGSLAWMVQIGLIGAAIILPAVCHLAGLPVRWILPMHWPALLAGVLYGWRAGLLVGALSPASNWLITGYPLPPVLIAMTLEITAYGFIAGWAREKLGWNGFASVGLAAVAGRAVFIVTIFLTVGYSGMFKEYIIAAMTPGLVAGAAQTGVMGGMTIWREYT